MRNRPNPFMPDVILFDPPIRVGYYGPDGLMGVVMWSGPQKWEVVSGELDDYGRYALRDFVSNLATFIDHYSNMLAMSKGEPYFAWISEDDIPEEYRVDWSDIEGNK